MGIQHLPCFKAYDVRGRVPDELNERLAEKIGLAYSSVVGSKRVVVGHDIRLSSKPLTEALVAGLNRAGVDVVHIGLCGTEEVYFATWHLKADGGIMVTASHNPRDYNGMKFVREKARPISSDTGLKEIESAVVEERFGPARGGGKTEYADLRPAYVDHLMGYVDADTLAPLKVVMNAGNGCAGPVLDALEPRLPLQFIKIHNEPDGSFPNGIPNPLLPENRPVTTSAVAEHHADLAVAWDGDFDRCFLFDEGGQFIEGYYLVGVLAAQLLATDPGAKVIYDPRLTWNTLEIVKRAGGIPVLSKSGHAFIKERMRKENAVYGGEMSAHHYFRDFSYCDSGMIPWLLVVKSLSQTGKALSTLVGEMQKAYPISGEINRRLRDADEAIEAVRSAYAKDARRVVEVDGVSLEFDRWRMNLRKSNTEPLVRLNVEARGDSALMQEKTQEVLSHLEAFSA